MCFTKEPALPTMQQAIVQPSIAQESRQPMTNDGATQLLDRFIACHKLPQILAKFLMSDGPLRSTQRQKAYARSTKKWKMKKMEKILI
jgi:hypothetical protein